MSGPLRFFYLCSMIDIGEYDGYGRLDVVVSNGEGSPVHVKKDESKPKTIEEWVAKHMCFRYSTRAQKLTVEKAIDLGYLEDLTGNGRHLRLHGFRFEPGYDDVGVTYFTFMYNRQNVTAIGGELIYITNAIAYPMYNFMITGDIGERYKYEVRNLPEGVAIEWRSTYDASGEVLMRTAESGIYDLTFSIGVYYGFVTKNTGGFYIGSVSEECALKSAGLNGYGVVENFKPIYSIFMQCSYPMSSVESGACLMDASNSVDTYQPHCIILDGTGAAYYKGIGNGRTYIERVLNPKEGGTTAAELAGGEQHDFTCIFQGDVNEQPHCIFFNDANGQRPAAVSFVLAAAFDAPFDESIAEESEYIEHIENYYLG